jgi:predicted O-methyltransferase YrrM
MSAAPTDLERLKAELEAFGARNDAAIADRPRRMLNITRDTGQFLAVLVRATDAKRVLEIGTSNGYSTIWLAEAARAVGGRVTTVEASDYKTTLASENFRRAGLDSSIELVHDDAAAAIERWPEASADLVFLDAKRSEYVSWWPGLRRALRPGGLLVVDNAISHAGELTAFVALVTADASFTCSLVPVGKGEFLAVRDSAPDRL